MRTLRLAQVAAQAEGLRLRRRVRRIIMQVALAVVALPFLLAALGFFEAAFMSAMRETFRPSNAALIVAGTNLVIALLLLGFATMRGSEDRISLEALQVRERAMESAKRSLTLASIAAPVAEFLISRARRRSRR
jgi:hypothetical protein